MFILCHTIFFLVLCSQGPKLSTTAKDNHSYLYGNQPLVSKLQSISFSSMPHLIFFFNLTRLNHRLQVYTRRTIWYTNPLYPHDSIPSKPWQSSSPNPSTDSPLLYSQSSVSISGLKLKKEFPDLTAKIITI